MKNRRKSRELALQVLYSLKMNGTDSLEIFNDPIFDKAREDTKKYAREIVAGIQKIENKIDEIIVEYSLNWKISRISVIDHIILKIALFELMESENIPPVVAINEAIDLSKKYSNSDSKKFINGILDKYFKTELNKE